MTEYLTKVANVVSGVRNANFTPELLLGDVDLQSGGTLEFVYARALRR